MWGGEEYQVGVRDYRSEPSFLMVSFGVNGAQHLDIEIPYCPFSTWFPKLKRVCGHLDPRAYSSEVISEAWVAVGLGSLLNHEVLAGS